MPIHPKTYTVVGNFDSNGDIFLAAYLPAQSSGNGYKFVDAYNVSEKRADQSVINAVLVVMERITDDGSELSWSATDPLVTIPVIEQSNILSHSQVSFDLNSDECLILLFHDNTFNSTNVDDFDGKIEEIYDAVAAGGSCNNGIAFIQPKKLGMSTVRKL